MRVWHARALALREGAAFFHRSAGACHRDVERVMKHPHLVFNTARKLQIQCDKPIPKRFYPFHQSLAQANGARELRF